MWEEVWMKVLLTLVGIVTTGLDTWLGIQIKKYRGLIKKEEDETVKHTIQTTISKELKPIRTDIRNLQNSETNFSTRFEPVQEEIEHLKDDITEILANIKQQGIDIDNLQAQENRLEHETRCAWRYRIRSLCHSYLRRGWMSHSEYVQLQEMFNIYTAIGGNGQTKELYERTMRLDIKTDAEIAAMKAEDKE